jgi:TatD DNase family protein
VDIGINLLDDMFLGSYHGKQRHAPDLDAVVARARSLGVQQLIITAGTLDESVAAAEMARRLGCFSTVGCHPTRCGEFLTKAPSPEQYLARLRAVAEKYADVVVAVGECGLDYDRLHFCPKDVQLRFFPLQIMLAAQLRLPLFLHNRNTGTDFIDICAKHRDEIFGPPAGSATAGASGKGGVVHSFTGDAQELAVVQALGFYVSVNGCSFKEDAQLDVARSVALNRLLLETDAPWCSVKPTHASHRLVLEAPAVAAQLARDFAADFPDLAAAEAALPPVRKQERAEAGCMVKDRCEPWEMVKVLRVMYALRKDEVASPFALSEMVAANTARLFGDRILKAPPVGTAAVVVRSEPSSSQSAAAAVEAAAEAAVARK